MSNTTEATLSKDANGWWSSSDLDTNKIESPIPLPQSDTQVSATAPRPQTTVATALQPVNPAPNARSHNLTTAKSQPSKSRYASAQPIRSDPLPTSTNVIVMDQPQAASRPKVTAPSNSRYASRPSQSIASTSAASSLTLQLTPVLQSTNSRHPSNATVTSPRLIPSPIVLTAKAVPSGANSLPAAPIAPLREMPNRNRLNTGGPAREKPSSSALDEKMRLIREKNAILQARAETIRAEEAAEEILVAKEKVLNEQARERDEVERIARFERQQLAKQADDDKRVRGAEMQARINAERKEMADRKLANVSRRQWDHEKAGTGPGSKLGDGNYPSTQLRQAEAEAEERGHREPRREALGKGLARRKDGWDEVVQYDDDLTQSIAKLSVKEP